MPGNKISLYTFPAELLIARQVFSRTDVCAKMVTEFANTANS
jgi:hypothetical protein